jgi:hypothetical protein
MSRAHARIHVELLGGRRPCTRSIHWPDKSAIAERFSGIAEAADDAAPSTPVGINGTWATENGDLDLPDGIDKSVLVIARPRRYGNREHLRYCPTSLPHLRPQTIRSASSSLPAAAGARPQSERRIRRPAMPRASPCGPSCQLRTGLVEGGRRRSCQSRPSALARNPEPSARWSPRGPAPRTGFGNAGCTVEQICSSLSL